MHFKAIFWDNDGVLVDTEPLYAKALGKIFEDLGMEEDPIVSYKEYTMKRGESPLRILGSKKGLSTEAIEDARRIRSGYYAEMLKTDLKKIAGVEEVLEILHGNIAMGVVTGSMPEHFEMIHEKTGFKKFFDFVVTRDQYHPGKPDPACYLLGLEVSGFEAKDCLVIEDSQRGVASAKAAGLTCWALPNHFTQDMDFSAADRVLSDIPELGALLGITD